MDHSNPVADSSRKKVRDIISDVATRRKQDLEYLATVVSGAHRVFLPSLERRKEGDEVLEAELSSFNKAVPAVDPSPLSASSLEFLEKLGPWPVSGLHDREEPVHPPGVHQEKGHVTTQRVFGGSQTDQEFVRRMLEYRPLADFQHSMKTVYTRGTAQGFLNRLNKLTSRKVPQITKSLKLNRKTILKKLRDLLPVDISKLEKMEVNWHADLADQLDEIETSSISSAGPPYWTKKPAALNKMVNVILPLVHRAISEGKVEELFKQQPELFLGEVKNKLDRYNRDKLDSKTRPYFGLPFHLQALFSMMSQPFTHAMELFWQGKGSNAYGHSWAHGGVEKLREWARETKPLEKRGRPRFCAYGDDTDIYVRVAGQLKRLAPDFQQMDGSVDAELVEIVIDYVVETLSAAWGKNEFFEAVAELWKVYATDPCFLVNGTEVYRKKQRDGLMTGVVGTTLFDTAKSVLAYDAWADEVSAGKRELLEYQAAFDFFSTKFGLVIKEGTWELAPVQEEPIPGLLWAPSRFLGVYFIYNQGPSAAQLVPYLNDEEWVDLIMNPRDDPLNFKRGRPKDSQTMISRRWYDRARGYTITGAFSNPLIQKWINGFVNGLDPVSISMSVMSGGGKGAPPENTCAVPETFEYPDSSGFPSVRWCENLYFTDENQWPEAEWISLLPSVRERLEEFRDRHKAMAPRMSVLEIARTHPEVFPATHAQQIVEYVAESSLLEFTEEVVPMAPITGVKVKTRFEKPNQRSKIVSMSPGAEKPKEKKRMPSAAEAIWKLFETKATPVPMPRVIEGEMKASPLWRELSAQIQEGKLETTVWRTPVMSLRELAERTGRKVENAEEIARSAGLYVLGRGEKFVTKVQIIPSDPKIAAQQEKQESENRIRAKVVGPTTDLLMKTLKHKVKAEPMEMEVLMNTELRVSLHSQGWRPDKHPMTSLNSLFHVNGWIPRLKSRNVQVGDRQLVETELQLDRQNYSPGWRWFLRRVGPNTKVNLSTFYKFILQHYKLTASELKQAKEYQQRPAELDWNDEIEQEERAKIYDETGLIFSVRGKYLYPLENLGEWMEIKGNRVALGGVVWKQRGSETLLSFLKRTSKKLEEYGVSKPHYQPLTSQPTPPKKSKTSNG